MIFLFIFIHWYLSLFFQTFFLHRYAAHGMISMSNFWEKVFFVLTWITQGSSFLNPRAYAVMHRLHHKHSDTKHDPHSPIVINNLVNMMSKTYKIYINILKDKSRFRELEYKIPRWEKFEKFADNNFTRLLFVVAYSIIYIFYSPSVWFLILVPIHGLMGPIHGAIVNWCGHKYGYRNYNLIDNSKNMLPVDIVTMGELLQNNHHKHPNDICFAKKWYEIDLGYLFCTALDKMRIIHIKKKD